MRRRRPRTAALSVAHLAVDFGERRVGIAISDPSATIAQPLTVLVRRAGKRPPVQAIADLVAEHGVDHIVIGLPLDAGRRGERLDVVRFVRSAQTRRADRALA
jgi:putative holliday junction resolvase